MLLVGQVQLVLALGFKEIYSICGTDKAAETATKAALVHGLKVVDVMVKGPGSGRERDNSCSSGMWT